MFQNGYVIYKETMKSLTEKKKVHLYLVPELIVIEEIYVAMGLPVRLGMRNAPENQISFVGRIDCRNENRTAE